MCHYVGLDVSLQETAICVLNERGDVIATTSVESCVDAIDKYLSSLNLSYEKILLESGNLSHWLGQGLCSRGYPMICVESRHMSRLLEAQHLNKNDYNDSVGLATMARANLYKEVKLKQTLSLDIQATLRSRSQLVKQRCGLKNAVRGLLKVQGIKLGDVSHKKFCDVVRERLTEVTADLQSAVLVLLAPYESMNDSIDISDRLLESLADANKNVKLLKTVDGIGTVTALSYLASIDDYNRFKDSESVGAYMGLTPKQYASGEVDYHGRISKCGPSATRALLYDAAISMMTKCKRKSAIKSWAMRLRKKKGTKKATTALARKLAVVMHRMLVEQKEFEPTRN